MKKWLYPLTFLFYCLILLYLLLPAPKITPLPDSFKSIEPGDTLEIPGLSAYYTNLTRPEVVDFYQKEFSRSSLFNFPFPSLRLNHPPEYAKEIIRETIHGDFFEELVHPWRESLFINGWTPKEDKEYQKGAKKPILDFERGGKRYATKITLYFVSSNSLARLAIFHFSLLAILVLTYFLKSIISSKWLVK